MQRASKGFLPRGKVSGTAPTRDHPLADLPAAPGDLVGVSYSELAERLREEERRGASAEAIGIVGLRNPVEGATGQWDHLKVSEDIILSLVDVTYARDTWIRVPGDHLFKIRVLLEGGIRSRDGKVLLDGSGAWLAVYPGEGLDGYFVPGGRRLRLLVLHCRAELLTERLALHHRDVPAPLSNLFLSARETPPVGASVRLGSELLRAANDISRAFAHYPRALRRAYVEALSLTIVCGTLRQLSEPKLDVPDGIKLTTRDIGRVYEARDLLLDNFVRPPSIERLARSVGLNQTKLKSAFRLVFGMTAYDLVRRCRMEAATELLLTTDKTIAEIAYEVGFEHPANFTHAYRRFFGHLPSDVTRPYQARAAGDPDASPEATSAARA
jgi:AraC-like DNA-binding protein